MRLELLESTCRRRIRKRQTKTMEKRRAIKRRSGAPWLVLSVLMSVYIALVTFQCSKVDAWSSFPPPRLLRTTWQIHHRGRGRFRTPTRLHLLKAANETGQSNGPSTNKQLPSDDFFFVRPAFLVDMGSASRILADAFFKGPGSNWITYQYEKFITYLSLEGNFPKTSIERSRHDLFVACDSETGTVLGVVEIDGRGAATDRTLKVFEASGRSAYMCNLAIDEKYRRRGIATSLVNVCEEKVQEWYKENERKVLKEPIYQTKQSIIEDNTIIFNTTDASGTKERRMSNSLCLKVRETDQSAVRLYQKLGYAIVSSEIDSQTDKTTPILLMRKQFGEAS